ncbi:NUDIX hydrolase [Streptomyces sp. NBC_01433]|uniref:NUDIX domain-containing protein n=1 Tax=Streptomyces sp. NBC_01433 TaxID=2903864 RepID=UPI00224F2673|nr:NUDIX hydrolase [Streptomyces sp. NBC_01433]MCX4677541.1 NUDIX hydrolase [Streptomyces sp. NBC_01433]
MPTTTATGHPVTAYALITDPDERLLTVRSKQAAKWHLPGGIVESGESPREAACREVREELGLTADIRETDLFAVEWIEARTPGARARLVFLFAGPVLDGDDSARIALQRTELDAWRWTQREEFPTLLHPAVARRIVNPLQLPGGSTYREHRNEGTTSR